MTLGIGGLALDISPKVKLSLKQTSAPLTLDTTFISLRPAELVAGVICFGVALGIPLKTTKKVPVPGLSHREKDFSSLDAQARVGIRRRGKGLALMLKEMNGILQIGPAFA